MIEVGDEIQIVFVEDDPKLNGRKGVVISIDEFGGVRGDWGGYILKIGKDLFINIKKDEYY